MNEELEDRESFTYDSIERQYVFVPGKLKNSLVVLIHPFKGFPEVTLEKFRTLKEAGFPILAPVGIGNSWNAGACCGKAREKNLDDVGFIRSLAEYILKTKFGKEKIFVYMTVRFMLYAYSLVRTN